jgi:hypothetical protein
MLPGPEAGLDAGFRAARPAHQAPCDIFPVQIKKNGVDRIIMRALWLILFLAGALA